MEFNQWKALPVRLRGGIIIAIPVICLFTSLGAFAWLKASLEEDETVVQHTKLVKLETKNLLTALVDTETGVRGYALTHREEFLAPYSDSRKIIPVSLDELESLVQDYPQQKQRLEEIRTKVEQHLDILQQKLNLQLKLQQTRQEDELLVNTLVLYDWLEEGKEKMNATRMAIDDFTAEQEELLEVRQQHQAFYRQITWIVLCLSAIAGTMGALLAILLFLQLERELREREIRLKNTNQELESAYAQLDRFTANASHELRAPLAAVLSNAQVGLMELEDMTEDTSFLYERIEKIVHLTKGMSTLVGDLLFLARESLLSVESLELLNVVDLLRVLTSQWQTQARSQHLTLTAHLPNRPIIVKADANLLRQAINNLLSNACRYTPVGGTIDLRLNSDNNKVLIEVEDTGIGISSQSLPHIFERFYRVNQTRTKVKGSFGLGLNIAQQIIQAHAGQITVTSQVDRGTTFQIILPIEDKKIEA